MTDREYYQAYEKRLQDEILKLCKEKGLLSAGALPFCDDIEQRWEELAPEYLADAVQEINSYPEATLAWAAFIGMAMAAMWDKDFALFKSTAYRELYGKNGFDDMDEHILYDIIGLKRGSDEAERISRTLLSCSSMAMDHIRHENVENQTEKAFFILVSTAHVMFIAGAAIELKRRGYVMEKIDLNNMQGNGIMS